jgi:HSP20 family protein
MAQPKLTARLRKALPYLSLLMMLVIGVQAWCLAHMHYDQKQPDHPGQSLFQDLNSGLKDSNGLPLWPDDAWDDPFFNGPLDANAWNPFQEMQAMQDHMNKMFGDAFGRFSRSPQFGDLLGSGRFTPSIDLQDVGDRFVIRIDLPGAENSQVDVSCKEQQVTISGTLEQTQADKDGTSWLRQERRSGRFSRTIPLPAPVRSDQMETSFDKGILTVTIPKAKP